MQAKTKHRVYISEELKESSLKGHIADLGYLAKWRDDILSSAKFACICSEKNISYKVSKAYRSGVPVILVSKDRCIPDDLKSLCDRAIPTHKDRHACFDEEEAKSVITWIDHCFDEVVKIQQKNWFNELLTGSGKIVIGEKRKERE